MSNKVFSRVQAARVSRSAFDLSYAKTFDGDMGILYPVQFDEMVPGDVFDLNVQAVLRFRPMVAPIMHEIWMYFHTFFVTNRVMWPEPNGWETFITGGPDGTSAPTIPTWDPTTYTVGSLWDHLGFRPTYKGNGGFPVEFVLNAYNHIYNEYYRDENVITAVADDQEDLLIRSWEKDYFTSALPWQQRGTAPALPVSLSGVIDVEGQDDTITMHNTTDATDRDIYFENTGNIGAMTGPSGTAVARWGDPQLQVDLSSGTATSFDISDFRLAAIVQRVMERSARAGNRYTEFIKGHWGVYPRDERLDRPEYVGGVKAPIIVSEVLQTSETGSTAQGELAGHGIAVNNGYIGRYHAKEYGVLMTIMSVMPKPAYQQGMNRQWYKESRWDYYLPELANLSEQAILRREIYANNNATDNDTVFGYQGHWDHMRTKQDIVCGALRYGEDFDHWSIARYFATPPTLNQTFLECVPRKDYLAAPSESTFVVQVGNRIKALRPLPIMSDPGISEV